jgi:NAD(P)-dependent dehydrogenase (short-subunit alcohol dehydrogenase family)
MPSSPALAPSVAVIAGVGPGLGAALARNFARNGCKLGLIARSSSYLEELGAELRAAGTQTFAAPGDLSRAQEIEVAFRKIRDELGVVDLLINHASAGGPFGQGILQIDPEQFALAWKVAALGGLLCARQVVPGMVTKGGGAILFSGATSSVRGSAISFSSAKFAVRGLAQALARELWPKGIHVAHVVIDAVIGDAGVDPEKGEPLLDPDAAAETYWQLATQPRSAWTLEVDLRPHREKFYE